MAPQLVSPAQRPANSPRGSQRNRIEHHRQGLALDVDNVSLSPTAPASLTMFSEQWGRMLSRQPRCEGVPNVFASRLRRSIGQAIAGTCCPSEDCLESGRQRGWTRVTVDVAISRPAKGQTLRQAARPGHRPAEPHQHDWESAPRVLRRRDWKQKAVRQIRRRYSVDAVIHSLYPSPAGGTKMWCSQLQKQWY